MSPWSPKSLRVVVRPDQVTLQEIVRRPTLRGLREAVRSSRCVPCDGASAATPWRVPLQALEAALPDYQNSAAAATVVVSNHFLRYAMVPWSENLADAEEELAFARHCFARVYGPSSGQWELRIDPDSGAAARLASAMDADFLAGLRGVFDHSGTVLKSVQPQLMAAMNRYRRQLGGRSVWFGQVEPDRLCLVLLDRGQCVQVRSLRTGTLWGEQLLLALEREAYLSDDAANAREVFLCTDEDAADAPPDDPRWQFHVLASGATDGGALARAG